MVMVEPGWKAGFWLEKAVLISNSFSGRKAGRFMGTSRLPISIKENTVPQGFLDSSGGLGSLGG